jgi:hypothetical protein
VKRPSAEPALNSDTSAPRDPASLGSNEAPASRDEGAAPMSTPAPVDRNGEKLHGAALLAAPSAPARPAPASAGRPAGHDGRGGSFRASASTQRNVIEYASRSKPNRRTDRNPTHPLGPRWLAVEAVCPDAADVGVAPRHATWRLGRRKAAPGRSACGLDYKCRTPCCGGAGEVRWYRALEPDRCDVDVQLTLGD